MAWRRRLFWGKAAALGLAVATLLIPTSIVLVAVLWALGGGDSSTLIRLMLLALGYGTYFALFGGLTLYASAKARSSRAALVVLIAIWGFFCLIMPRAGTEVASVLQPLPSQAQLARDVSQSLTKGIDGKMERDVAIEAITTDLMASEGLADTGMLVQGSAINGIELQAEAKWEDMIYDHHMVALDNQIQSQENVVAWMGFLSPFVAMRELSAGLCGTDFAHHRHFTEYTEVWRKQLVTQLNKDFADNAGGEGWEYKAGPDLWKKVPPFAYEAPSATFALQSHRVSILALVLWLLAAIVLALRSAQKVRVL